MRFISQVIFAALMALLLSGAMPAEALADPPRVSVTSVSRVEWKDNRATLDMLLDVTNPSGVDVQLSSLKFSCVFAQVAKTHGETQTSITIPSNDHASVPVRLTVSGDSLTALALLVANGRPLDYRLDGTAELGPMGLQVPFTKTGRIALPF